MSAISIRGIGQIDPNAIRRAVARTWRKGSHGGGKIPCYVVTAMHDEYRRAGSLRAAAATFSRTKQDLSWIFRSHGLPVKSRGGPNRRKEAA